MPASGSPCRKESQMNHLRKASGLMSWVLPEPLAPTTAVTLFRRQPASSISKPEGVGFLPREKSTCASSAKL
ncbi:hypothetical protein D3C78_1903080 [compost metagenome]